MFSDIWQRRQMRQKIALLDSEYKSLRRKMRDLDDKAEREKAFSAAMSKNHGLRTSERNLEQFESQVTLRKACHLALEIPRPKEKPTWWNNDYEHGMPEEAVNEWLSVTGRIAFSKMIRLERRANFEWWFTKIVLPALQALVPIIALILGLVSVAKQ